MYLKLKIFLITSLPIVSLPFFSCTDSQNIYEKIKLPEKGEYILVSGDSGKKESEGATNLKILIVFPTKPVGKNVFELDLQEVDSVSDLKSYLFQYREYLVFNGSKKLIYLPDQMKKDHNRIYFLYGIPELINNKYVYKNKNSIFEFTDLERNSIDKLESYNTNIYDWNGGDYFYFVDEYIPDEKVKGAFLKKLKKNILYSYNIKTRKKEELYNSGDFYITNLSTDFQANKIAMIEYNNLPKGSGKYVLKILDIKSKKVSTISENLNYIRSLAWSPRGQLVLTQEVNHTEGFYPPESLFLLDQDGKLVDLLNLPLYDSPGFIFGEGFRGVKEFTFTLDGNNIIYLSSEKGGCRMVDEGGNIRCKLDIYSYNLLTKKINRITDENQANFKQLKWIKLD